MNSLCFVLAQNSNKYSEALFGFDPKVLYTLVTTPVLKCWRALHESGRLCWEVPVTHSAD